jgi:hypothetical protein
MIEAEEKNAHYLAKAREDPYSLAILEVAKVRLEDIIEKFKLMNVTKMGDNELNHLMGQLFAFNLICNLPEEAQKFQDTLPKEPEA